MASKRRLRRRTCQRKRRHDSFAAALGELGKLRRQGKVDPAAEVYGPCRFCGGYHLGRAKVKSIQKVKRSY